jgi:dolichol-phosphate mannosyltransferase
LPHPGALGVARRLLRAFDGPRFLKFCIVGLSGMLVNLGILALLHGALALHAVLAFAVATEVSILTNFVANDLWTFRDLRSSGDSLALPHRIVRYNTGYLGGVAIQLSLFTALWGLLDIAYLVAALGAITTSTLWNYGISRAKVWGVAA